MLLPLNSGAYEARGKISSYLVCENLFPEMNPQEVEAPTPVAHYPREGLRPLSAPPEQGRGRGVFTMSNGNLYGVVGPNVYAIDNAWKWTLLGQITDGFSPTSMSDNNVNGVLVDGTVNGYTVTLATNAFAPIVDDTGLFQGSRRVDYADTFLAFSTPGTNQWYTTLSDQVAFNALAEANKASTPDNISAVLFNLRNAWVLGTGKGSEVWYNAGNSPFPYEEWPNVFIPYGCSAPYSVTRADVDLFWLSRNEQGQTLALKTSGMSAVVAVSTRALEYEWSKYHRVDDVIGGTFQQAGHTFVIFHFPTADVTWGYDLSTKQWHKRVYTDGNGVKHREKVSFYASVGGDANYPTTIVGQDWQTGQIYALDPEFYTDNGQPIVHRRTFPHVVKEMHMITESSFVADFATGGVANIGENGANTPVLFMRYSNNGGAKFTNYRPKKLISAGNYRSMMRWRGLGMARDRIFELMWSFDGPSALNGAFIDAIEHSS